MPQYSTGVWASPWPWVQRTVLILYTVCCGTQVSCRGLEAGVQLIEPGACIKQYSTIMATISTKEKDEAEAGRAVATAAANRSRSVREARAVREAQAVASSSRSSSRSRSRESRLRESPESSRTARIAVSLVNNFKSLADIEDHDNWGLPFARTSAFASPES